MGKQFDEIRSLHLELSTVLGMEDIDIEFEEIEERFETRMQDVIRRIGDVKDEAMNVELKRIQVPCFGGKVEEWSSFHHLHKNDRWKREAVKGAKTLLPQDES